MPDFHYRKFIVQLAPVLLAGLIVLQHAVTDHTPLTNLGLWAQVVVTLLTAAAVYIPANPWVKLGASLAGAVGAALVAALTDNVVTLAEAVQLAAMVLAFVGVGAVPNTSAPAGRSL